MKLHQVTLPALDLTASIDFYQRLGLRLIVHVPPRYARFETPEGETLSLHRTSADGLSGPEGRAMVYFEVADLDARYRELVEAGVQFDSPPEAKRWLWREARLHDPSGNPLCLFHAGDARRFPPWRIE